MQRGQYLFKIITAFSVLGLLSVLWFFGAEEIREQRLSEIILESYGLANPGMTISNLVIVKMGSVYRAVFRLEETFVETYIDAEGKYLFSAATDINAAENAFKMQKSFFECLVDKGVTLFGQATTNGTIVQMSLLGNSPYLGQLYFDCSGDYQGVCVSQNITSVPSWRINGQIYPGILPIPVLESETECTYGQ